MKIKTLLEDTVEQVAKQVGADDDSIISAQSDPDQIKDVLDEALYDAIRENVSGGKDYPNVLFIGKAGTGKTSRIKQWAKDNNINLVTKQASVLDETDLGGAPAPKFDDMKAVKLTTSEFDALDQPDSVLFLDEFNRARPNVRGTLLTLIQDHMLPDASQPNGQKYFPEFLFTIAAINPADADYNTTELDDAERSRFREINVIASKREYLNYIEKELNAQLDRFIKSSSPKLQRLGKSEEEINKLFEKEKLANEGRIAITKKLLSDNAFRFDNDDDIEKTHESGNGKILTNRSFSLLLKGCNGTKDDFIKKWSDYCNSLKLPLVKQILADYKDETNKANDLLKDRPTQSSVFNQGNDLISRIRNAYKG